MFPGQGSQAVGMGCDMAAADPVMREAYAEASAVLGYDLQDLCCQGPMDRLSRTDFTQPALLAASVGMFRILQRDGLEFDVAIGHSLGEFSALVATGAAWTSPTRCASCGGAARRCCAPPTPTPGGMAAVIGLVDAAVEALCAERDGVWPANFNSPGQVVVSGRKADLGGPGGEGRRAAGAKRVISLAVSGAFHSPLVQSGARPAPARSSSAPRWRTPDPAFFSGCSVGFETGGFHTRFLQRAARLAGPLLAVGEHVVCRGL